MSNSLLIFDFDNTIAETFLMSPGVLNVEKAYEQTIADIFGQEGIKVYYKMGGLKNRAPSELVHELLQNHSHEDEFVNLAKAFFAKNEKKLIEVVPQGKGIPLVWDNESPDKVIIEMVVRQKLIKLLPQIKRSPSPPNYFWPQLAIVS